MNNNKQQNCENADGASRQVEQIVRWRVDYDNDVGLRDEGFWEWWTVVDTQNEDRYFKCDEQKDAKWLCDLLNRVAT